MHRLHEKRVESGDEEVAVVSIQLQVRTAPLFCRGGCDVLLPYAKRVLSL